MELRSEVISVLAIITFMILLIFALYMLNDFYICSSDPSARECKAFRQADKITKAKNGSNKDYFIALLGELCNDGIWPLPYIGAAILTPLSMFLIGVPITVRNFATMFLISFIVVYFMFTFFGHHYAKIIAKRTSEFIRSDCSECIQNKQNTTEGVCLTESDIKDETHFNPEFSFNPETHIGM